MGINMGKDKKHDGKADGDIIWVEKYKNYLPDDVKDDELASKVEMLIAIAKEDHAKFGYAKEMKHYIHLITDVVRFAKNNGYKPVPYRRREKDDFDIVNNSKNDDNDSKWDDITDA